MDNIAYYIIFAILSIEIVVLLIVWNYYRVIDMKLRRDDKLRITGKVVSYTSRDSRAPVVAYSVNGKEYRKALRYSYIISKGSSFKPIQTSAEGNLLDTTLRLQKNTNASVNTVMRDAFPIGSGMNVYYAQDNPKVAYVERYAPSMMKTISLYSALVSIIVLVVVATLYLILN